MQFQDEGEFEALIGGLPVGVLVQGPQAEILLNNAAACYLLGITQDQLLGKTSFDPDWNVIHEDGSPFPGPTHPVPQAIMTLQPVQHVVMGVYRPRLRDRVWLLVDAIPRLHLDGTLRDVICTFSNITESRRMDAVLSEIIKAVPDLLIRLKRDGTFVYFQPSRKPGDPISAQNMTGKKLDDFFPSVIADQLFTLVDRAIKTAEVQVWELQTPVGSRNIDREMRVVAMSPDEVLIIARDVTAEKQAARDRLEYERARLLSNFINNISHDFRTPITVLKTSLYLLRRLSELLMRDSQKLQDELKEVDPKIQQLNHNIKDTGIQIRQRVGVLEQGVTRLTELADSMIDVVRLDQHYVYRFENYDLNQLARLVINELMPLAVSRNLAMSFEAQLPRLMASVDIKMLSRSMKHLIENAIQYTGVPGTIVVRVYEDDRHPIFEVEDTGVGIGRFDLEHIFERFYRVDQARPADGAGAGLGLAIVKDIVEAHNGTIEVKSQPGQGSIFRIVLNPTQ